MERSEQPFVQSDIKISTRKGLFNAIRIRRMKTNSLHLTRGAITKRTNTSVAKNVKKQNPQKLVEI